MKCQNCSEVIPPTFVAAIKENKCPACGQPCLTEKEHTEVFSVVANITSVVTDVSSDVIIKMAVAMHGKFDIFPKGVVEDNVVTKEVIYINAAPQFVQPVVPQYTPQQYTPPLKPHMRPAPQQQPTIGVLRPDQMTSAQRLIHDFENQDNVADDGIHFLSKEDLELENMRKTRELMNRHKRNAAKAGGIDV